MNSERTVSNVRLMECHGFSFNDFKLAIYQLTSAGREHKRQRLSTYFVNSVQHPRQDKGEFTYLKR